MAIWSIMGGAMFFSADLTSLNERALSLLTNEKALQVSRDWEGVMGLQKAVVIHKNTSFNLLSL